MSDKKGDPNLQPDDCPEKTDAPFGATACPHITETYSGWDGERYFCPVCGESFFLDYEEMK